MKHEYVISKKGQKGKMALLSHRMRIYILSVFHFQGITFYKKLNGYVWD